MRALWAGRFPVSRLLERERWRAPRRAGGAGGYQRFRERREPAVAGRRLGRWLGRPPEAPLPLGSERLPRGAIGTPQAELSPAARSAAAAAAAAQAVVQRRGRQRQALVTQAVAAAQGWLLPQAVAAAQG